MAGYHTKEQEEQTTPPFLGSALESSVRITLTTEMLDKVKAIDGYDLWFVVERLRGQGVSDERIESAVAEFKKYMALFALGYEEVGMISREVDEVWHAFILFTREYTEFCRSIFGRYIHHAPNSSRSPLLSRECVVNFTDAYTRVFGPLPSIWGGEPSNSASAGGGRLNAGECSTAPRDCEGVVDASTAGDCNVGPTDGGVVVGSSAAGDCSGGAGPACNGVASQSAASNCSANPDPACNGVAGRKVDGDCSNCNGNSER